MKLLKIEVARLLVNLAALLLPIDLEMEYAELDGIESALKAKADCLRVERRRK